MRPNAKHSIPLAMVLLVAVAGCQLATPSSQPATEQQVGPGDAQVLQPSQNQAQPPSRDQVLGQAKSMQVSAAQGGSYVNGTLKAVIPPGALSKDATIRIGAADTATMPINALQVPGIAFAVDLGGATLEPGQSISITTPADPRFVDAMKKNDPNFTPAKYSLTQDAKGNWLMTMTVKGPQTASTVTDTKNVQAGSWGLEEDGPGMTRPANLAPQYSVQSVVAATDTGGAGGSGGTSATATAAPSPTPAPTPTPVPVMQTTNTADQQVNSYPARPLADANKYPIKTYVPFWSDVQVPMAKDSRGLYTAGATVSNFNGIWAEFFTCLGQWHPNCGSTQINQIVGEVALYDNIVASGRDPSIDPASGKTNMSLINDVNAYTTDPAPNCDTSGAINLKAAVSYQSDPDSGLNTTAVGGATVTWYSGTAGAYVNTTSDADGSAFLNVGAGTQEAIQASKGGFASALSAPFTVSASTNHVHEINIPKWSPRVELKLSGATSYTAGTLTVKYTVDGDAGHTANIYSYGQLAGFGDSWAPAGYDAYFYAKMPNDAQTHVIKLTSVTASPDIISIGTLPQSGTVGYHSTPVPVVFDLDLISNESAK